MNFEEKKNLPELKFSSYPDAGWLPHKLVSAVPAADVGGGG